MAARELVILRGEAELAGATTEQLLERVSAVVRRLAFQWLLDADVSTDLKATLEKELGMPVFVDYVGGSKLSVTVQVAGENVVIAINV